MVDDTDDPYDFSKPLKPLTEEQLQEIYDDPEYQEWLEASKAESHPATMEIQTGRDDRVRKTVLDERRSCLAEPHA